MGPEWTQPYEVFCCGTVPEFAEKLNEALLHGYHLVGWQQLFDPQAGFGITCIFRNLSMPGGFHQ